jgi:hypothetical protein
MKSYNEWLDDVWIRIWVDCDYDADEEHTRELFVESRMERMCRDCYDSACGDI